MSYADQIKTEANAKTMRSLIANGIEVAENLRQDYDAQVINAGSSNAEIVDARGGKINLKTRLDNIDTQLNENTTEINNVKTDLNIINNVKSGSKSDIELYSIAYRSQYVMRCMNVIGDSISHGCNTPVMYEDGWAGIMRKFIQLEYNTKNHGFVNVMGDLGGSALNQEFHHITNIGGSFVVSDGYNTNEGNNSLGSSCLVCTTISGVDIQTRKPSKFFKILYSDGVDYGEFDVYVNGVKKGTVSPSVTSDNNKFSQEFMGDENNPFLISIITKYNTKVRINGFYYYNNISEVMFNNYGRSGLRLSDMPVENLFNIADTELLFFALGTNDPTLSITEFTTKINLLINYCNKVGFRTKVVILDFMWVNKFPNFRAELKRLADNTNSIYIDYPSLFGNMTLDELQTAGYLSDICHPTPLGHQLIAEICAKKLGFGVTSKNLANKLLAQ